MTHGSRKGATHRAPKNCPIKQTIRHVITNARCFDNAASDEKWRRYANRVSAPFSSLPSNASLPAVSSALLEARLDDRRKGIARPVQPRLHRAEIAVGNLCDLLVRFAFELAQH